MTKIENETLFAASKAQTKNPHEVSGDLLEALQKAADSIAPTWPLDQSIAVNPFWPSVDRSFLQVAAEAQVLRNVAWLPSATFARDAWNSGRLQSRHIEFALTEASSEMRVDELLQQLAGPAVGASFNLFLEDAKWPAACDEIARLCEETLAPPHQRGARLEDHQLFSAYWRTRKLHQASGRQMPEGALQAIAYCVEEMRIPAPVQALYFRALLLRLWGWASRFAYCNWIARLRGEPSNPLAKNGLIQLAAILLTREFEAFQAADLEATRSWREGLSQVGDFIAQVEKKLEPQRLLLRAMERAHQEDILRELDTNRDTRALADRALQTSPDTPDVQCVFCIDVRSEPFRRALEQQNSRIQTLGFAGFFGLPIEYDPGPGRERRVQMPGLLAPKYRTRERAPTPSSTAASRAQSFKSLWHSLQTSPASSFALVESTGIASALSWWKRERAPSLRFVGRRAVKPLVLEAVATQASRRTSNEDELLAEKVQLAKSMLRGMTIGHRLAPLVVLVGHASKTTNNAQKASLDCGACCGQSGEINARLAASILNDSEVRLGLREEGSEVPSACHFVAALHTTTTDQVELLLEEDFPSHLAPMLASLERSLEDAATVARRERSLKSCPADVDASDPQLLRASLERATNWSETRPEWGLAGNASFVIAPRARTHGCNFEGRCFLHEYLADQDAEGSILEGLLTAPVLVTHWINMQYYAAVVHPEVLGSGNKTLHNIVGERVGVLEGAGGDLRFGLSKQSVHDGAKWMHEPLRLSVWVEAHRSTIDAILLRQQVVRDLVKGEWIHLFSMEPESQAVFRWTSNGWIPDRAP